jgi:hypothetical protein
MGTTHGRVVHAWMCIGPSSHSWQLLYPTSGIPEGYLAGQEARDTCNATHVYVTKLQHGTLP